MNSTETEPSTKQDALLPTTHYAVQLPAFEGPLDLLLYLIRKHEIDIYDIPIETITRQYLDYIYSCDSMNLEITGEFFVMAATLMVIKSRMLLPKQEQVNTEDEEEESEEDPRWELVQQLLDYKKVKEQAKQIDDLFAKNLDLIPRICNEKDLLSGSRPLKNTDRIELWNTFNLVLQRLAERMVNAEIHEETHSVSDRMNFIIERLKDKPRFYFSSLIPNGATSLNLLVTTFLAMLELSRLKILGLEQTENYADILCIRQKKEEALETAESFQE